jgi:hypothetical protein
MGIRKKGGAAVLVLWAALFAGCASTGANRVDASTQIDLTGRWNDSDIRIVCDTLVSDCLSAGGVDRAVNQFSAAHRGGGCRR